MDFFTFSSGSPILLSSPAANTDLGPRLFDGNDVFIYNSNGSLLVSSDGGATWSNVIPPGVSSVRAITQGESNYIMFYNGGIKYRTAGTTPSNVWTSVVPSPLVLNPIDAVIASESVLVGNAHAGTESRIYGATDQVPYSFSDSDTGIPQYPTTTAALSAVLTDLEAIG